MRTICIAMVAMALGACAGRDTVLTVQAQDSTASCTQIQAEILANHIRILKGAADKQLAALQARQQYLTTLAIERCAPTPPPQDTQSIEQGATTDETSATTATQQNVHQISPAFGPARVALSPQSKKSQPERRQLIAISQVSVCYLSASAVRQEHPQARPSWTLHALGHEGTRCWYPATGPKDDPKSHSN
jgi:hypothetical protein